MNKSKKIFLIAFILFMVIMLLVAYDISQRTTAPWHKHKTEHQSTNPKIKAR